MTKNKYDSGRLNLPFVGICTFGKYPYVSDWDSIDTDIAILGAPFDCGSQYRSGSRFGPRGIREASTLFSFGHAGAYDHEDDVVYLPSDITRIVDIGAWCGTWSMVMHEFAENINCYEPNKTHFE